VNSLGPGLLAIQAAERTGEGETEEPCSEVQVMYPFQMERVNARAHCPPDRSPEDVSRFY
jgi:hypothetical protein